MTVIEITIILFHTKVSLKISLLKKSEITYMLFAFLLTCTILLC